MFRIIKHFFDKNNDLINCNFRMICGVRARVEHASGKSRPKPWLRGGAPMGCG